MCGTRSEALRSPASSKHVRPGSALTTDHFPGQQQRQVEFSQARSCRGKILGGGPYLETSVVPISATTSCVLLATCFLSLTLRLPLCTNQMLLDLWLC